MVILPPVAEDHEENDQDKHQDSYQDRDDDVGDYAQFSLCGIVERGGHWRHIEWWRGEDIAVI